MGWIILLVLVGFWLLDSLPGLGDWLSSSVVEKREEEEKEKEDQR